MSEANVVGLSKMREKKVGIIRPYFVLPAEF